jgi:hypothetical protein
VIFFILREWVVRVRKVGVREVRVRDVRGEWKMGRVRVKVGDILGRKLLWGWMDWRVS